VEVALWLGLLAGDLSPGGMKMQAGGVDGASEEQAVGLETEMLECEP